MWKKKQKTKHWFALLPFIISPPPLPPNRQTCRSLSVSVCGSLVSFPQPQSVTRRWHRMGRERRTSDEMKVRCDESWSSHQRNSFTDQSPDFWEDLLLSIFPGVWRITQCTNWNIDLDIKSSARLIAIKLGFRHVSGILKCWYTNYFNFKLKSIKSITEHKTNAR